MVQIHAPLLIAREGQEVQPVQRQAVDRLFLSACRELLTFLRNMRAGNLEKFPQIISATGTTFQYCGVYGKRQFKEESHAAALHERRGRRNSTD